MLPPSSSSNSSVLPSNVGYSAFHCSMITKIFYSHNATNNLSLCAYPIIVDRMARTSKSYRCTPTLRGPRSRNSVKYNISTVSQMTSLRNKSNMTSFTTLYTTERTPLWALWYYVRRMSSNNSSTSVASSSVTSCFTGAFTSPPMRVSSGRSSIFLRGFSGASLPLV